MITPKAHVRADEIARLRDALRWYADGCPTGRDPDSGEAISFKFDDGERARVALRVGDATDGGQRT